MHVLRKLVTALSQLSVDEAAATPHCFDVLLVGRPPFALAHEQAARAIDRHDIHFFRRVGVPPCAYFDRLEGKGRMPSVGHELTAGVFEYTSGIIIETRDDKLRPQPLRLDQARQSRSEEHTSEL